MSYYFPANQPSGRRVYNLDTLTGGQPRNIAPRQTGWNPPVVPLRGPTAGTLPVSPTGPQAGQYPSYQYQPTTVIPARPTTSTATPQIPGAPSMPWSNLTASQTGMANIPSAPAQQYSIDRFNPINVDIPDTPNLQMSEEEKQRWMSRQNEDARIAMGERNMGVQSALAGRGTSSANIGALMAAPQTMELMGMRGRNEMDLEQLNRGLREKEAQFGLQRGELQLGVGSANQQGTALWNEAAMTQEKLNLDRWLQEQGLSQAERKNYWDRMLAQGEFGLRSYLGEQGLRQSERLGQRGLDLEGYATEEQLRQKERGQTASQGLSYAELQAKIANDWNNTLLKAQELMQSGRIEEAKLLLATAKQQADQAMQEWEMAQGEKASQEDPYLKDLQRRVAEKKLRADLGWNNTGKNAYTM